jgi:sodium pump decarboxylase gamma subunit
MSVGTITLVGISIVFLSFVVLYVIFRLLAFIFGDKGEKKTTLKQVKETPSMAIKAQGTTVSNTVSFEEDTELVAVISAAIAVYNEKPVRILSIKENIGNKSNWRNHRSKIWRPVRKGVKRTW